MIRAKALSAAGTLAWTQGDYEKGESLDSKALEIYREIGDSLGIARSLCRLGMKVLPRATTMSGCVTILPPSVAG